MWSKFLKKLAYLKPEEIEEIKRAFDFAKIAHKNQKRASGEPYIVHPLKVAMYSADYKLEKEIIISSLLHDVYEDTNFDLNYIQEKFGKDVAFLINGVSAVGKLQNGINLDFKNRNKEKERLKLQKLFLAASKDLRVLFIRIFDRKHNMENLEVFSRKKQMRKAMETLNIYAPLAKKIGMSKIGLELEDRAFAYLYPHLYKKVKELRKNNLPPILNSINKIKERIISQCRKNKINVVKVNHRIKSLYSLSQKLKKYNISNIYDLVALRIIVKTKKECYGALGVVHQLFRPMEGRFKDFIARPKPNGYQSLHTTVFIKGRKPIEIQIRTLSMHRYAEYGIAAHWLYKEEYIPKDINKWIKTLNLALTKNYDLENLFGEEIYVFTPKGDVVELPKGSTALDFAFIIHSEVGKRAKAIFVNNQIKPLDYKLQMGEMVRVEVGNSSQISPSWLDKVYTEEAKEKIRRFLREQDKDKKIKISKEYLSKKLHFVGVNENQWKEKLPLILKRFNQKREEELLLNIYEGKIKIEAILSSFVASKEKDRKEETILRNKNIKQEVCVGGASGLKIKLSKCCFPRPSKPILGYVCRENYISIHSKECPVAMNLDKRRVVPAWWRGEKISAKIIASDRPGLLKDIASIFARRNLNILSIESGDSSEEIAEIRIAFEKPPMLNYIEIIKSLEKIKGIKKIIPL